MTFGAPGVIERAYQLAQTSAGVEQIRQQLRKEGYSNVDAHLAGRKIRSDLVKIIRCREQADECEDPGIGEFPRRMADDCDAPAIRRKAKGQRTELVLFRL